MFLAGCYASPIIDKNWQRYEQTRYHDLSIHVIAILEAAKSIYCLIQPFLHLASLASSIY